MEMILAVDLLGLDQKDLEWYQMCVRAIIIFIVALIFIRMAGMRTFGTHSAFDVVLSITLGAVLSRCITGHYPFFSCLGAAVVLVALHRTVAYLSYRSKRLNKITEGDAILLYEEGQKKEKNLLKYCIPEKELMQAIHEENMEDFSKVKTIWLEPDGKISIVKKED